MKKESGGGRGRDFGGSNSGSAWCGGGASGNGDGMKKERVDGDGGIKREGGGDGDFGGGDFGGLREHRHRRLGGGKWYYTTTEQMHVKHNTIDLTSEADGGVGLAADEAAEVAMAVAAIKAADGGRGDRPASGGHRAEAPPRPCGSEGACGPKWRDQPHRGT
jgi:hypothetical protein